MEIIKEIIETITGWILLIIIIYIICKKHKEKQQRNIQQLQNYYNDRKQENINKVDIKVQTYELNRNIFTDTEKFFYNVLKDITNKMDLTIMSKVRLADIVHAKNNDYKYFNKIKSKHIDFVLIDKDCNIKLLIELDDNSHLKPERQKRDIFVNNIFKDKNIKLLRIQAKYIYNETELEKKIKESLFDYSLS